MQRRFVLLLVAAPLAAAAQPAPMAVTTDTPEYCTQLAHAVADHRSPQDEVVRLLVEGREMCARGEVRGGISRLRHAMLILHHPAKKPRTLVADPPPGP